MYELSLNMIFQLSHCLARREEIQPILPGVSGLFYSRQSWSKERRDPTHPLQEVSGLFYSRQSWSKERRDPTHPLQEVSGLLYSRQGWSKERRDLPHPTKIFAMQHRASAI